MAYASSAGFNPVLGLYSGMLPTLVDSVFARTVLMATSAIALSSQSVLLRPAWTRPTCTTWSPSPCCGPAHGRLWLAATRVPHGLRFERRHDGFTTGIASQIVVGVIKDATGYIPQGDNTLGKLSTPSSTSPTGTGLITG
jgi:SulP family sulfate permease